MKFSYSKSCSNCNKFSYDITDNITEPLGDNVYCNYHKVKIAYSLWRDMYCPVHNFSDLKKRNQEFKIVPAGSLSDEAQKHQKN